MNTEQLGQIQAPLPDEARMEAYYYDFERTGLGFVDAILSAVAIAGKGSHHTESWNEESDYGYYANRPGLPAATSAVDLIQKAADVAAENVTALLALVRSQQAQIERVRGLHTVEHIDAPLWQYGYKSGGDKCAMDGQQWPCETIAALTATEAAA